MSTPIILWLLQDDRIRQVKCTMATASVVRREGVNAPIHEARSSYTWGYSYHDLWEEAHQELLAQAERKLEKAQGNFDRIKGLKPPTEDQL